MKQPIAIDGPSASGKSTVARGVARALDRLYVDSGALYRGVTWLALQRGIDSADGEEVERAMRAATWDFFVDEGAVRFSIDGVRPPEEALRGKAVREAVSLVAAVPGVRAAIVDKLRSMQALGPLVMEGRDIGTVVFPDTPHKFYLDADPRERAMRRYRELIAAGENERAEEVMESLRRRDAIDSSRKTAPLTIAPDARVIDTTHMTLEEVIETILKAVREKEEA